jgi:hypothetical protein
MPAQLRDSRFHRVAGSCRLFEKHQKCGFVPQAIRGNIVIKLSFK